jgi:hypothetical protein
MVGLSPKPALNANERRQLGTRSPTLLIGEGLQTGKAGWSGSDGALWRRNRQQDETIDPGRDGTLGVVLLRPRGSGLSRNKRQTDSEGETQNFRRWRAHA